MLIFRPCNCKAHRAVWQEHSNSLYVEAGYGWSVTYRFWGGNSTWYKAETLFLPLRVFCSLVSSRKSYFYSQMCVVVLEMKPSLCEKRNSILHSEQVCCVCVAVRMLSYSVRHSDARHSEFAVRLSNERSFGEILVRIVIESRLSLR